MKYAIIKYYDIANGTGVRTSLFVSGCRHACKGCFNREAWDFNYGSDLTDEVMEEILNSIEPDYIAGLSLLGGEPMELENQEGLIGLVKEFKKRFKQKNIWCYTGFSYEADFVEGAIAYGVHTKELLEHIDVLVDGKFIQELYDISLKFRGSSNQRIIDLNKTREEGNIILVDI